MEDISHRLKGYEKTLDEFQSQRIPCRTRVFPGHSQRIPKGSRFQDIGSTNYIKEAERKPRKGNNRSEKSLKSNTMSNKNANTGLSSQMSSKMDLCNDIGSDSADELNLTENSSQVGTPEKPINIRAGDSDSDLDFDTPRASSSKAARMSEERIPRIAKPEKRPAARKALKTDQSFPKPLALTPKALRPRPRPAYIGAKAEASQPPDCSATEKVACKRVVKPRPINGTRKDADTSNGTAELKSRNVRKRVETKKAISKINESSRTRKRKSVQEDESNNKEGKKSAQGSSGHKSLEVTDENRSDTLSLNSQNETRKHRELCPFPMASPDFNRYKLPLNLLSSPRSSKKRSSDDSDCSSPKRGRWSSGGLEDFDMSSTQVEVRVDPKSLCPYCDQPLPPCPSPCLLGMLDRLRHKSYRDPRPDNALGLKAPLISYIDLCQRHRFESKLLPKARKKGWPTSIDFSILPGRVRALERDLRSYLLEKDKSHLWQLLKKEIDEKGALRVMGIQGQFNNFERSQPGYYGEQGFVIIYQTLYSLFPLEEVNADLLWPLAPTEFLQRILVPEAAAFLVQQDMGFQTKLEAYKTLRESSSYGNAMFPETDDRELDGTGASVGEQMVYERVKAKRKEIDQESEESQSSPKIYGSEITESGENARVEKSRKGIAGPVEKFCAFDDDIELGDIISIESDYSHRSLKRKTGMAKNTRSMNKKDDKENVKTACDEKHVDSKGPTKSQPKHSIVNLTDSDEEQPRVPSTSRKTEPQSAIRLAAKRKGRAAGASNTNRRERCARSTQKPLDNTQNTGLASRSSSKDIGESSSRDDASSDSDPKHSNGTTKLTNTHRSIQVRETRRERFTRPTSNSWLLSDDVSLDGS